MADEKPKITIVYQDPPKRADTLGSALIQLLVFGLLVLALVVGSCMMK